MSLTHSKPPAPEAVVLSPLVRRLVESAREEEKLLAAIREAVLRGEEGKDEVFRLASELTRSVQPTKAPPRNSSDQPPILRLLPENCSDSVASDFFGK